MAQAGPDLRQRLVFEVINKELKEHRARLKEVEKQTQKLAGETEKAGKKGGKLGSLLSGGMKKVAGVFAGALASIVSVKVALIDTVKAASQFEKEFAEVTTLFDTAKVSATRLRSELLDLAGDSPTTLSDLTKGLYQTISAGIDASESVNVLRAAMQAAVGGVTTTTVAVDALTSVINAWGLESSAANDIADAFFVAVRNGKTTFAELGESIGAVAPLAAQLGVEYDELLSATAALTTAGVNTKEAMTQVRSVLVAVAKQSPEALEAAKKLGIQFNTLAVRTKGLKGFIDEIIEATGGSVEAISALFGRVEALNGVLALGGSASETFGDNIADMARRAGSAQEAFRKMEDTSRNAWDVIKSKFNIAMVNLGSKILPMIASALEHVSRLFQAFDSDAEKALRRLREIGADPIRIQEASLRLLIDVDKKSIEEADAEIDRLIDSLSPNRITGSGVTADLPNQFVAQIREAAHSIEALSALEEQLRQTAQEAVSSGATGLQARDAEKALEVVRELITQTENQFLAVDNLREAEKELARVREQRLAGATDTDEGRQQKEQAQLAQDAIKRWAELAQEVTDGKRSVADARKEFNSIFSELVKAGANTIPAVADAWQQLNDTIFASPDVTGGDSVEQAVEKRRKALEKSREAVEKYHRAVKLAAASDSMRPLIEEAFRLQDTLEKLESSLQLELTTSADLSASQAAINSTKQQIADVESALGNLSGLDPDDIVEIGVFRERLAQLRKMLADQTRQFEIDLLLDPNTAPVFEAMQDVQSRISENKVKVQFETNFDDVIAAAANMVDTIVADGESQINDSELELRITIDEQAVEAGLVGKLNKIEPFVEVEPRINDDTLDLNVEIDEQNAASTLTRQLENVNTAIQDALTAQVNLELAQESGDAQMIADATAALAKAQSELNAQATELLGIYGKRLPPILRGPVLQAYQLAKKGASALTEETKKTVKQMRDAASVLDDFADAGRSMLRLVDIFGDLSDQAREFVGALLDGIDNAGNLVDALAKAKLPSSEGGFGSTLGAVAGIAIPAAGIAGAVVSGISSFFGGRDKAQEQARREQAEATRRLVEALRDNANRISDAVDRLAKAGKPGGDISGRDQQFFQRTVRGLFDSINEIIATNTVAGFPIADQQSRDNAIQSMITGFFNQMASLDIPGVADLREQFDLLVQKGVPMVDIFKQIFEGAQFAHEGLLDIANLFDQTFGESVAGAIARFDFFTQFMGDAAAGVQQFGEFMLSSVEGLSPQLREALQLIVDGADPEIINDKLQEIAELFFNGSDAILGALSPQEFETVLQMLRDAFSGTAEIVEQQSTAFADANDALRIFTDFLGLDAIEALRRFIDQLLESDLELAPELSSLLDEVKSLDLTGEAGQQRLSEIIKQIASGLLAGTDFGIDDSQVESLLRTLQQLGAEAAVGADDQGFSRSVQVARTITEIQANEFIAELHSQTFVLEKQLTAQQAILQILADEIGVREQTVTAVLSSDSQAQFDAAELADALQSAIETGESPEIDFAQSLNAVVDAIRESMNQDAFTGALEQSRRAIEMLVSSLGAGADSPILSVAEPTVVVEPEPVAERLFDPTAALESLVDYLRETRAQSAITQEPSVSINKHIEVAINIDNAQSIDEMLVEIERELRRRSREGFTA